jgi:hypothetical protein
VLSPSAFLQPWCLGTVGRSLPCIMNLQHLFTSAYSEVEVWGRDKTSFAIIEGRQGEDDKYQTDLCTSLHIGVKNGRKMLNIRFDTWGRGLVRLVRDWTRGTGGGVGAGCVCRNEHHQKKHNPSHCQHTQPLQFSKQGPGTTSKPVKMRLPG